MSERATAHGAEVIGGLANVDVDGVPHDVLLLDRGLVLAAYPKKKDGGKVRLRELLDSAPVVELAERHRFVAFEDVAAATVVKRAPVHLALTLHSGESLSLKQSWSGDTLTKRCGDAFFAIAQELGAVPTPAQNG